MFIAKRRCVDFPMEPQPKITTGAGGTPIAFDMNGHGPMLIPMHGGGMDRHMWAKQMAALDEDFTVVAFDLRGHGESGKPEQVTSFLKTGKLPSASGGVTSKDSTVIIADVGLVLHVPACARSHATVR
jgi:pimeloyl-ACP methyl ester carboxylesterase